MSIGNEELKSKGGTPPKTIVSTNFNNNNINNNNNNNNNTTTTTTNNNNNHTSRHYTSYKNTKPKPSKVKYLTYSELQGIGLSVLLSLTIALTIVFVFHKFAPIVFNVLIDVLNVLFNDRYKGANNHHHELNANASNLVSKFILLKKNLNCTSFKNIYFQKHPVLFQSNRSNNQLLNFFLNDKEFAKSDLSFLNIEYLSQHHIINSNQHLNITKSKLSFTMGEYNEFEYSINNEVLESNYYYSDHQILTKLQQTIDIKNEWMNSSLLFPGFKVDNNNDCPISNNNPLHYFTNKILSIGKNISSLSGISFHVHKQRLNELLYGRKQWVLYKNNNIPNLGFSPFENLDDWINKIYLKSKSSHIGDDKIYEIIQEAGEIVYIPEGWYHATKTISDLSISISYESTEDESYGTFYYYLIEGNKKLNKNDFKGAIKLYRLGLAIQPDYHLYQQLAYAYEKEEAYHEAEESYREIIKNHPRNPYPYVMLINLLITYSSADNSVTIATLLQQGADNGIRENILKLMQNVI